MATEKHTDLASAVLLLAENQVDSQRKLQETLEALKASQPAQETPRPPPARMPAPRTDLAALAPAAAMSTAAARLYFFFSCG